MTQQTSIGYHIAGNPRSVIYQIIDDAIGKQVRLNSIDRSDYANKN